MVAVQVCPAPAISAPIDLGKNDAGRIMQMVIIGTGQRYGRDLCLTNDAPPLVEFNDCTNDVDLNGRGQFTGGRYYISSILERPHGRGLILNGGNANVWHISAPQMLVVVKHLKALYPNAVEQAKYAEDAEKSATPWQFWQCRPKTKPQAMFQPEWTDLDEPIVWHPDVEYRRKPTNA